MTKDMSLGHIDNKRVAKNTLILYIRMLFLMGINLYTSRVVLVALGIEDYGVYNAVGGFITMFSMISSSLSAAISRFLTFMLGQGDFKKLERVFSSSIMIQLALGLLIIFLVESFGTWFLNTKMSIPEGSCRAANWVLQLSLLTFLFNLISVPYNAALVAHEKMDVFAYIGIFEGASALAVALLLNISPINKLTFYSFLMCGVAFTTRTIYASYCKSHFQECAFRIVFDKKILKEMFGFAGWNLIGSISGILRSQGLNILFNVYNGPVVNAARGLAVQVETAVTKFSGSFYTAVQPQITKSFAAGDISSTSKLACRSSRLAFLLLTALSLPIIFETDFILNLWLKEVPEHTTILVQITLIFSLLESFSQPLILLMLATGEIKNYQLIVGGINLLNFPIAWIILHLGYAPELAQASVILFAMCSLIARTTMLKNMVDFPTSFFYRKTVFRCSIILLATCLVPYDICQNISAGWGRLFISTISIEVTLFTLIFIYGLEPQERAFVKGKLHTFFLGK